VFYITLAASTITFPSKMMVNPKKMINFAALKKGMNA